MSRRKMWRSILWAVLAGLPAAAQAQALTLPAPGLLQGLRPEVLSGTVMLFHDGVATDALGTTEIVVTRFRDTHAYLQADLAIVGLGGRDSPSPLNDGHFFFYLMRSLGTNAVGIVASRSETYGGVVQPAGGPWLMRKLPYGHPYRRDFGGFTNVHVEGWPHPTVIFTDSEYTAAWMPLAAGPAHDWTDVDMSAWMPGNARLGHFVFETRDAGVRTAGSCYVRSHGGQATGLLVGSSAPGSPGGFLSAAVRVDSLEHLQYRCTPGSRLYIQIRGYSITEAP